MRAVRCAILAKIYFVVLASFPISAFGQPPEVRKSVSDPEVAQAVRIPQPNWLNQWLSGPLPGQPLKLKLSLPSGDLRKTIQPPTDHSGVTGTAMPFPSLSDGSRLFNLTGMEERLPAALNMYLGVGIVASSGQTVWNHDATSGSSLLGNPTSELTYGEPLTLALEVNGRFSFADGFFVRGYSGIGISTVGEGILRDDDFLANQVLSSSTDSLIPDTDLFYATADIGKEVANIDNRRGVLSLFAGIQYWREKSEAYGLYNRLTSTLTISENTPVLSNTVEWVSFRLGATGSYRQNDQVTWTFDLAAIPYTDMHNEDSHLLRTDVSDLGAAPNIIMDGSGYGFEGEIGFIYAVADNLSAAFDIRYWHLVSDGKVTFGPQSNSPSTYPLNDLDTFRLGVSAGMRYNF